MPSPHKESEALISEQLVWLPLYDTIKGTIERFHIGDTRLRELGAEGQIETRKFGKRVLINQHSVLAYLQSLPTRAAPQPIERAERGRFRHRRS
jgi:hypothetical protein